MGRRHRRALDVRIFIPDAYCSASWHTQNGARYPRSLAAPFNLAARETALMRAQLAHKYSQAHFICYGGFKARRIAHTVFASASLSQIKRAWLYKKTVYKPVREEYFSLYLFSFPSLFSASEAGASSVSAGCSSGAGAACFASGAAPSGAFTVVSGAACSAGLLHAARAKAAIKEAMKRDFFMVTSFLWLSQITMTMRGSAVCASADEARPKYIVNERTAH